jgi:hypothetical protein
MQQQPILAQWANKIKWVDEIKSAPLFATIVHF